MADKFKGKEEISVSVGLEEICNDFMNGSGEVWEIYQNYLRLKDIGTSELDVFMKKYGDIVGHYQKLLDIMPEYRPYFDAMQLPIKAVKFFVVEKYKQNLKIQELERRLSAIEGTNSTPEYTEDSKREVFGALKSGESDTEEHF